MTRTWLCCGLSRPSAAPRCRLQWPPDRASEEVSRWPENLCQHTTSGLECARGSRDQSGKDGGMCARNGDFGREVLKEVRAVNRANTGERAKKSQPDQGWDFTLWWRWAESNRRPKVLRPRPYMLILAVRSRRRAARQAKRTRKPVC